ncbi:MAG: zf-HC2 domain-containing protein, partial [Desulfobacteraceae bacterium]|nr:zf-HC2 domain-containing protein [Desulfobacteraceae bacterium]
MEDICRNIQEQILELIADTLSAERKAELQQHIAVCPGCSKYLKALQGDDRLLGDFVEVMQPRVARLEEKVIGALNREPSEKPISSISIWRTITRSRVTKFTAAAVIIVAVLVGVHQFGSSIDGTAAVYADAIKALQNVNTVHVYGWTTRIHPKLTDALDEPLYTSKQYQIEIWEWVTENGEYRIYDRQGPITVWDDADRNYEYNEDKDLLYIGKSVAHIVAKDFQHFQSVTTCLNRLKDRGIKVIEIGTRTINNRPAQGLRVERDNKREDIWLDSQTSLMLENNSYIFEDGQWSQWRHGALTYNQNVPANIRAYVPPDTKNVRYSWDIAPRFEKWHLHLRKIASYYQRHPLPETMELLPRERDEKIDAYAPGRLPGITNTTGQWVLAIQSTFSDFMRNEFQALGSLRVRKDLRGIRLNYDLVTKNEHTKWERVGFVLDALGLELAEITEQRKVWVAHYDGRPLKPWRQVKAPVPNPHNVPLRPGMASTFGPTSMKQLFDSFAYWQDYNLTANKLIIVDETGLPSAPPVGPAREKSAVSCESPYWGGDESIEIAKKWFKEQFGVTFTE